MNPIDARARHAVQAISESLALAAPPTPFAVVARRALIVKVVNATFIGLAAVLFIGLGAALRTPLPEIPVADTSPTVTTVAPATSTSSAPGPSVVALPPTTEEPGTTPPTTVEPPATTEPPVVTAVPTTTEPPTTTTTTTITPTTPPPTTEPPDTEPPKLEIKFPENRQRLTERFVIFRGITEPGAEVTVRDRSANVDDEGNWRIRIALAEGHNRVTFTATDAAGNASEASVTVFYLPPDLADFTAHATFGSCDTTPPFDVYYGTGHPDTSVLITSEYGSATTKISSDGNWEVKVYFPTAPHGEPFLVRAVDEFGRFKSFEFVSYAGGDV